MAPTQAEQDKTPKKSLASSDPTKPTTLTAKEGELLLQIMVHAKTSITTDWDAVAAVCGYKNGRTAQARFSQIRKAHGLDIKVTTVRSVSSAAGSSATSSPAKTPTKRIEKATKPHTRHLPQVFTPSEEDDEDKEDVEMRNDFNPYLDPEEQYYKLEDEI